MGCGEWTTPRYLVMAFAGAVGQHGAPEGADGGCARPRRQRATGGISSGETDGGLRETVSISPWPLGVVRLRISSARVLSVFHDHRSDCVINSIGAVYSVGLAYCVGAHIPWSSATTTSPAHLDYKRANEELMMLAIFSRYPCPRDYLCRHSERLEKQAGVVVTYHPLKHTQWYT